MTRHSMHKFTLAAFSGAAVLMLAAYATVPANAATGKFRATPEELRRHCWKIDKTFWLSKRRYGCGEVVVCTGGSCRGLPPPPPPPNYPPTTFLKKGDGGNGEGGARGGGGGGDGGGQSSSAGGPN